MFFQNLEFFKYLQDRTLIRFGLVSALNFIAGYLVFVTLWFAMQEFANYLIIASVSTILSSILSYQSQNRFTLNRNSLQKIVSLPYLGYQAFGLFLASVTIPFLADKTDLNLLIIQFAWSLIFSLLGLVILKRYSK